MQFIKVELTTNPEEGFTSLIFTARDDTDENRDTMDKLLRLLLDPALARRGGAVPGNAVRVDFNILLEEEGEAPENQQSS